MPQSSQSLAILDLHANLGKYFKFIADRTYLQLLPEQTSASRLESLGVISNQLFNDLLKNPDYVVTLYSINQRSRIIHDLKHATRVAAYIDILHNFKQSVIHADEEIPFPIQAISFLAQKFAIKEQDILMLTKLAAFFHDSARSIDYSADYWDEYSAKNCYDFLIYLNISEQLAKFFANSIKYKEFHNKVHTDNIEKYYRELFPDLTEKELSYCHYVRELIDVADTLDVMRCVPQFFGYRLDQFFCLDIEQTLPEVRNKVEQLIVNIYKCINEQYSNMQQPDTLCSIVLKKQLSDLKSSENSIYYIVPTSDIGVKMFHSMEGILSYTLFRLDLDPYQKTINLICENTFLRQFCYQSTTVSLDDLATLATSSSCLLFSRQMPILSTLVAPSSSNQPTTAVKQQATVMLQKKNIEAIISAIDLEDFISQRIIPLQRKFRSKKRIAEHRRVFESEPQSTIYTPEISAVCSENLAARIVVAAQNLSQLSDTAHVTNKPYLKAIFDGALHGRENLNNLRLSYIPASLSPEDINRGDGNVICCGLGIHQLDPVASGIGSNRLPAKQQTVVLMIKPEQVINPCRFVKDHDFGWNRPDSDTFVYDLYVSKGYKKLIAIGNLRFYLIRSNSVFQVVYNGVRIVIGGYLGLTLLDPSISQERYQSLQLLMDNPTTKEFNSRYHNHRLYYGQNIKQFFVMQFFRYIDQFDKIDSRPTQPVEALAETDVFKEVLLNLNFDQKHKSISDEEFWELAATFKKNLYLELNKATDAALSAFAETIFTVMSEGAEYNLYGCYKFAMQSLTTIFIKKPTYWEEIQAAMEKAGQSKSEKEIGLIVKAIKTLHVHALENLENKFLNQCLIGTVLI